MIDLATLINQCVNPAHKVVMEAIIKVESSGNPLVLGLNKGYKLQTQPKNEEQAKAWAEYLEQHDYNFDVGLGQVNIKNIHKYGYKAKDMLDPCLNLKIASDILDKNYQVALATDNSAKALQKAISAYNTGNFNSGFSNGYVHKVNAKLGTSLALNGEIPPIISTSSKHQIKTIKVRDNETTKVVNNNHQHAEEKTEANPYSSRTVMFVAPQKASREEYANATNPKTLY